MLTDYLVHVGSTRKTTDEGFCAFTYKYEQEASFFGLFK